jgi:hypothetical protein
LVLSKFSLIPVLKGKKTRIEFETLGDPKGWIPDWLINSIQEDWPIYSLNALREQLTKPHVKLFPLPPESKKSSSKQDAKETSKRETKSAPKEP